jgi:hypothetical protein
MNRLAQEGIKIAPEGGFKGFGPLGENVGTGIELLAKLISTTIGIMTIIAFIWFAFVFFSGAIAIIGSGGDKQAYEGARKKITTGLIGLVVTIAAIFVVNLLGVLLGIDILSITELFTRIQE